ncbi:MAG TPA: cysteine desulfurase CsdA, partial [Legionellales bacterium]|nr:cysteine desulfurase CsdA [Legionellales bacterium]
TLRVAPINQKGEILLEEYAQQFTPRTKFVALSYASNALGTINPVKKMIDIAHEHQVPVLLDGAQATAHLPIDIHALDCDFYAFSSHKMYGPAGIGVLWGKTCWLEEMRPYQGGGEMIQYVTFAKTEYAPIPAKFEAGTPNIEGVIGLGAAIDYLDSLDMTQVMAYEHQLCCHATESLKRLGDYRLIGEANDKVPVVSFVHPTIHAHDIGTILDTQGVAIRSGHHCAMPIMDFYGVAATTRLSLSFYNTLAEIDAFMAVLAQVKEVFA